MTNKLIIMQSGQITTYTDSSTHAHTHKKKTTLFCVFFTKDRKQFKEDSVSVVVSIVYLLGKVKILPDTVFSFLGLHRLFEPITHLALGDL